MKRGLHTRSRAVWLGAWSRLCLLPACARNKPFFIRRPPPASLDSPDRMLAAGCIGETGDGFIREQARARCLV